MNIEHRNDSMASMDVKIGIAFIVQVVIGTVGNFSFFSQDIFLCYSGYKKRSTDLILRHQTVANFLVILSKGIPETMARFGLEHFLSDFGCKFVFYVHVLSRGVSFGSTCLLSVFQAITISPRDWKWAQFKRKVPKYTSISTAMCWVLHLLLSFGFAVSITSKLKTRNITDKMDFAYCSDVHPIRGLYSLSIALISISDILCMGLMLFASGSMVCILYRHKQQVQHIHRSKSSSRSSPESRATHSVLVLVSVFVFFYTPSAIMHMYLTFSGKPSSFLHTLGAFINGCFPTICPFLLLSCGHSVSRVSCISCARNTEPEPSHHSRKNLCTTCFSVLSYGRTPLPRTVKMQGT
ncbi:PREDICTED: vomeronasal type-1 receptor 4-like [Chinchilla lanigera]|uniref:vomeronasal type-1 receptor 4-like n=1 Tax=Chinchilla lanigera TaxID=34839 RepID=UPI00038EB218|nr:PREDICTED: vomeronasal type-1 receptor 4-like [Chinchilla lanigera]